jgi:RNA-splicing ligase RtcB
MRVPGVVEASDAMPDVHRGYAFPIGSNRRGDENDADVERAPSRTWPKPKRRV